ncbi:uncharacterized protein LOC105179987 isoform X1 [Sesamum indicum]|uniref:Uncharacterized protein LOC105179987 isoform X1 n=1 Tax=Sesamum indicum TaxID=4182 RepID=A0A6I9UJ77_SESIN|nr:uncharacterized protein LOC105179987 isoform X1 [Sesamum indicum]
MASPTDENPQNQLSSFSSHLHFRFCSRPKITEETLKTIADLQRGSEGEEDQSGGVFVASMKERRWSARRMAANVRSSGEGSRNKRSSSNEIRDLIKNEKLQKVIYKIDCSADPNNLVDLYKGSSEEWSQKAIELEGIIKALELPREYV